MKLNSDTLTRQDIIDALPPGVHIDVLDTMSHTRVRAQGWTVSLGCATSKRYKNHGLRGADDGRAASYDQHGEWMAALYEIDPQMRVAHYQNRDHFHAQTDNKYKKEMRQEISHDKR